VRFRFAAFLPSVVPGGVVYAKPGFWAVFLGGNSIFPRYSIPIPIPTPLKGGGMEWNGYLRKMFFIPRWKSGMESGTPVEREVEREVERLKTVDRGNTLSQTTPPTTPGLPPA